MITARPALIAVTTPFEETVAIFVLLDDHLTFLLVADEGETFAVSVFDVPVASFTLLALSFTEVTGCVTVILHCFVYLPSTVVAVITTVPVLTALTTPLEETVAIFVLELFQVTPFSLAFEG